MDKQHADGRSCAWPGGVWQSWSLRSRFFLAAALALCVTVLMVVLLQSALTSADQQERVQRYELPAQLQSVAARVQAQLNLATRLQTTDKAEIGRMCEQLNRFLERLRTAFRDVRTSVNAIHANAGSIARGNQDLAQRWSTRPPAWKSWPPRCSRTQKPHKWRWWMRWLRQQLSWRPRLRACMTSWGLSIWSRTAQ